MNIDPLAVAAVAAGAVAVDTVAAGAVPPAPPLPPMGGGVVAEPNNPLIVRGVEIEGIGADVPEHVHRHAIAFYDALIPRFQDAPDTFKLFDKAKWSKIMTALLRLGNGETKAALRKEFNQIHKWEKKYAVISTGPSQVLVQRSEDMLGDATIDAVGVFRFTYLERVFADLLMAHGTDHNKGRTLYKRVGEERIFAIARPVCQLFTDTCPHCIQKQARNKPAAGIRPIVTHGFNVRGQVDLIDLQSMLDGSFRFLLNYIDHGIKLLFSMPIVRKRGSCIALALLEIFTIIGPPMILQSDNGSEFHGAAMNNR